MFDADSFEIIRVLCVDDHPLVRKGIASILNNEKDMDLVGEAENGIRAIDLFRKFKPDVTLMDMRMPEMDGIEASHRIRSEFPNAKIIALTSFDGDQDVFRAIAAGVSGYLLKEMVHTEILKAIRLVQSGGKILPREFSDRFSDSSGKEALTSREVEVLRYVAKGLANKEIGAMLGISSGTIKIHVQNMLSKLGATDRTHAVTIAIQRGILHL